MPAAVSVSIFLNHVSPHTHRDVKSANVLVRSDSGDCVISDLGFALILDGKQTTNTVQVIT